MVSGPRFVIVCGGGGVGKTTTSAAVGMNAARAGERVLVITVDPARRLAQALGIDTAGRGRSEVPVDGSGSLHVSMLDTKAGWDALIRRHARDAATAERVLRNPLYDNITARFVNSHDYIAMEQVNELSASADYDLVVVDTPPSRNGLDVLFAPQRMKEFFGGRLLQWLTLPYRNKLLSIATKPFLVIADRLLGAQFLGDIAEFFALLQSMEKGFIARAEQVELLLTSPRVECMVVTIPEMASVTEAGHLIDTLRDKRMAVTKIVVNRVVTIDSPNEVLPSEAEVGVHVSDMDVQKALAAVRETRARGVETAARHAEGIAAIRRRDVDVCVVPLTVGQGQSSALAAIGGALQRS